MPHGGYGGGYPRANMPHVPDYMTHAILATVLCCLPFGVIAIVQAAKVSSSLTMGDVDGAWAASEKAKTWCWASFISGAVVVLLYGVLAVFSIMADKPV